MTSDLSSLFLPDDHVRKINCPCPFCTCKYEKTSGFFGLCINFKHCLLESPRVSFTDRLADQTNNRETNPFILKPITKIQKKNNISIISHYVT